MMMMNNNAQKQARNIGQMVGGNNMINEAERQRGLVAALGQTNGSTGETTALNASLGSGTTSRVPYSITVQPQQVGTPPPAAAGNMNIQADSIAAILQAARRGDVAGQLEDDDDNDDQLMQMTAAGLKDCDHGRSRLASNN